jgi:hypothetical protein
MLSRPPLIPKYRHYRPKNFAVVRIDGRDHYLGAYNPEESRERYRRLIAEWLATKSVDPARGDGPPATLDVSVNEILLAYLRRARPGEGATSWPRWVELPLLGKFVHYCPEQVSRRPTWRLYAVWTAGWDPHPSHRSGGPTG